MVEFQKRAIHGLHLVFSPRLHFAVNLMHCSFTDVVANGIGDDADFAGEHLALAVAQLETNTTEEPA